MGLAGYTHGGIVLLGTVDSIGELGIGGHVVELGRGLVVDGGPGVAAVEGHAGPAVVALYHSLGVVGVNPQVVVVTVGCGDLGKGETAV